MDIELLSKIVGELILKHDQVGLPGIGTFVAELVPASFSDKGYTINPPYRRLTFTSENLEENIFIDFYSASNNIEKEAAVKYLANFFASLKKEILERRTVVFPGLGRMRTTKDDKFFFVPNEDLDIFPEGFGLEPVSLKTHIETQEEIAISVSNLANIMESNKDLNPEDDLLWFDDIRDDAPKQGSEDVLDVFGDSNMEVTPADVEPAPEAAPEPEPAPEPKPAPEPEPAPEIAEPQDRLAAMKAKAEAAIKADEAARDRGEIAAMSPAQQVAPEVIPEAAPAPAPEVAPEAVPATAPVPEPVPEAVPQENAPEEEAPSLIEVPAEAPVRRTGVPSRRQQRVSLAERASEPEKPKKKFTVWHILLILIGVAFLVIAVFLILAVVAPDFVDSILYTPEELRIINY